MAIEGPLRELGIHDVFQLLDLSRKTGVLRVNSELRHNAGTLYFEAGAIIFAEIRSNPHPLGAALLRAGKITEADLDRARDMQERLGDKRRLGDILVSLGAITARELQRQVRFQIEEVVFEVMSWREGYFSFTDGALTDLPSGATVRIPTEALLMEGARRIDEWSRMESRIPHLGVVPTLAPLDKNSGAAGGGGGGGLDLLPAEWETLAMVDGRRDVRTIARELGRSDFEVAKTLFGRRRRSGRTMPCCTCCSAALASQPGGRWRRRSSCVARSGSTRSSWRRTACSDTRWSRPAASRRPWSSGTSGSGSRRTRRARRRSSTKCGGPRPRHRHSRGRGRRSMLDEIKTLSSQLAQDPDSLVFLRLGELLRRKGQLEAAHRVALTGLERHPHLADAHDVYARVLADKRDYERAFDEWDMALRIAPSHVGALKGLAFLYFTVGTPRSSRLWRRYGAAPQPLVPPQQPRTWPPLPRLRRRSRRRVFSRASKERRKVCCSSTPRAGSWGAASRIPTAGM